MPPFRFCLIVTCTALVLPFALGAPAKKTPSATLSPSDLVAIRSTLERYRGGWLANDPNVVRCALTENAVLMPHHGLSPVAGMAAINEFWWPAGGPKVTITRFVQTVDEVGGNGTIGYVRGRSEVTWRVGEQNTGQNWRTGGNFMALLRLQANGRWLITHLIWDDPPNQQIE